MRAENELVFKQHNERVGQHARNLMDGHSLDELIVGFVCECSNDRCSEKLHMPVTSFEILRRNAKQFIILPGHEQHDIERVVVATDDYTVVEKFKVPAETDGKQGRTRDA